MYDFRPFCSFCKRTAQGRCLVHFCKVCHGNITSNSPQRRRHCQACDLGEPKLLLPVLLSSTIPLRSMDNRYDCTDCFQNVQGWLSSFLSIKTFYSSYFKSFTHSLTHSLTHSQCENQKTHQKKKGRLAVPSFNLAGSWPQ